MCATGGRKGGSRRQGTAARNDAFWRCSSLAATTGLPPSAEHEAALTLCRPRPTGGPRLRPAPPRRRMPAGCAPNTQLRRQPRIRRNHPDIPAQLEPMPKNKQTQQPKAHHKIVVDERVRGAAPPVKQHVERGVQHALQVARAPGCGAGGQVRETVREGGAEGCMPACRGCWHECRRRVDGPIILKPNPLPKAERRRAPCGVE